MITTLQSELDDAVGLIELGEAEGDMEVVAEAEEAIGRIVQIAEKRQLKACYLAKLTVMTVFWKFMPVPVAPRRRTGPRCWHGCIHAGVRLAGSRCR